MKPKAREYKHLYHTKRWLQLSLRFRIQHPHCVFCDGPAQCVDHKTPHKGNLKLFWDLNNLQAMCFRCHDSDKYRIELGQIPGKDFVINNKTDETGLPLSKNHPWNND